MASRWLNSCLLILVTLCVLDTVAPFKLRPTHKRGGGEGNPCPKPDEPFPCRNSDKCIPLVYLCDENQDCDDGYDENPAVCTAAKRPPVEEMEQFLQNEQSWIMASLFPGRTTEQVARALAVSQTVEDYRKLEGLSTDDVKVLCEALDAMKAGREEDLKELGMPGRSWNTVYFFFSKLIKTGFSC